MAKSLNLLHNARIASPCPARWEEMNGDDRVRFCDRCEKHVYNLVDMEPDAAAALVREKNGDLCARAYQRADGTLLMGNCPVGLAAVRRRIRWLMGGIAAGLGLVVSAGAALGIRLPSPINRKLSGMEPFSRLAAWFAPPPPAPVPMRGRVIMGDFAALGYVSLPSPPDAPSDPSTAGNAARQAPACEPNAGQ